METKLGAFSRPDSATQDNDFSSDIPELNLLACTTGGLRSLYDGIRFRDSKASLAVNSHTSSDGHFVPRQGMMLASRYHIVSQLEARGQSAVLLEAKDSFRKMMPVVIKVMHTSYFDGGMKEAQMLRRTNSADPRELSHTVRLLNSFRFENHICLVFPLLNPLPLGTVIARKCLSKDEMLSVFRKISLHLLSALAFLRRENIIHADVKPENILVHKDGSLERGVTLIDFGSAIQHIHQEVSLYHTDFELQTQAYRAPEVHLGHPFGVEVDMWSFGCVLLELLTGKLMFAGTDRADSLQKMMTVLGPLPSDMCKRGKFYPELASVLSEVSSTQKIENGALRLMSAFPCIRNYDLASFLAGLLTYHPDKRLTPWEALQHPFMAPEICIPYFLSDTTKDSGVIRRSDYSFRQSISANIHHRSPSKFDHPHAGTSDRPLMENRNLALVEPFDPISRPEKGVASQQKYSRSLVTHDEVAVSILSSRNTKYRTEKDFSLPTNMTTLYRIEKRASLPSERTTYRTERCASLPSEMTTYRTERYASLSSEMTTYRTERCASLPSEMTTYRTERCASLPSEMTTYRTERCASLPSEMTTYRTERRASLPSERTTSRTERCTSLPPERRTSRTERSAFLPFQRTAYKTEKLASLHTEMTSYRTKEHASLLSEMTTNRREKYASLKPELMDTNTCVKSIGAGMYTCLTSGDMGTYTCLKSGGEVTNTCLKKSEDAVTYSCLKKSGDLTDIKEHLFMQSCCLQEPQQVYMDPVIQKPVHEKVGPKNVVEFNKENQLTSFSETGMNGDELNQQNYLCHQTLSKITLSSPGRRKNTENWQPQLRMLDMLSEMYSAKRINDCSHIHEQRDLNEHSHNKEQTGKMSQNTACVFNTLLTIDKTGKRSRLHNLNTERTCATTGKEIKKPFNVPGNCNEVTIVSKLMSENEDTPKSELVRQAQKVMKSVKLPHSRERQSKTKHQRLSRKAKSDYQYVKDVHHAINDLLSEVDAKKRQSERRNLSKIGSPKKYAETPFIYKYPTGSQNWMSGTLETVSTQQTDNAGCRDPGRILEPVPSLLKQPSAKTKSDMIDENSRSDSDAVDYREVSSLNGSFKIKHPLRLTRKRKMQEIDYFNQTDKSFHKKRSRKQLSSTGFVSTEKDGKTKKLTTEMQKENVQAKSQKVQEELFHTQKNSKTLQINSTANHKMKKMTQSEAGMRNVSNILNTSGISKSRMAKKSATFKKDNPVFRRNIKSCFPNRIINNLQNAQERTIGKQPSDASRLLRAKAVKRALSFNTKSSPQITYNGKFTVTNKKAGGTLSFSTPVWKTENGWTSEGKENHCFNLSDTQSSGSSRRINSKGVDLLPPVDDLNLSDPYEFKVSPVKPQGKITVNPKQTKTACQRRSKLRSQTSKKRNNRLVTAAKSVICCASSVSISDLVEQKSKYLFPGNNEVIPLATMIHNHQQKCEENNEKCLQTGEVQINTNQCTVAGKTEFPCTESTMSKNAHMKTSPLQVYQPVEVLPTSACEESKLSSAVNSLSSSSKDTPLMKVPVSKNNIVMIVDNKGSQSVALEEANTALGSLYFEKQLSGNKQFVENSKTDKLPAGCSSCPQRVDDYKSTGHDVSTVVFKQTVKLVSGNCNDESSSDEEVLLLD